MDSLEFFCSNEGYEHNTISIAKRWTGADSKKVDASMYWDDLLPILHEKVTACNLVRDDGSVMTDIKELASKEDVECFDPVLQGFIGGILQQAVARLKSLGNVSARVLSSTVDGKK